MRSSSWTRIDERLARRPSRVWLWAVATTAVLVAVLALPAPRAIAQRLWDQVVLGRLQVLITNYDEQGAAASVFSPDIQHQPELRPVASLEEAGRIAGFSPQLPAQIAEVYGPGTITALWGGSDRVYALWGKINAEFVARVAKTL
jgi:hypothetical protein